MADKLVDLATLDLSKITFSDVKQYGSGGGKNIYINYNKQPLYIKTPTLNLPFGLSCWEGTKYSLRGSLGSEEGDDVFVEKIRAIENLIIETAVKNSNAWFKKKDLTSEMLTANFTSCISPSDKYQPLVKFQITKDTEAFLSKSEPIPTINSDTIPKKSKVAVIAHLASIYIIGNTTFGISAKAVHIKVTPPKVIGKPMFVVDSDVEDDADVEDDN